jgi:hypothetical protein
VSSSALARDVEERLGRTVFAPPHSEGAPRYVIAGEIRASDDGRWRAHLALVDPAGRELGQRTLVGSSTECEDLTRSVAIVVSLLVDQQVQAIVLYEPRPAPPSRAAHRVPAAAAIAAEPTRETAEPGVPWRATIGLGGAVTGLGLPGPAWSVRQATRLGLPGIPLSIALEGLLAPPFVVRSEDAAAEVWMWSTSLLICPELLELRPLSLVTCAGASIGQIHARGIELDVSRSGEGLHAEIALRAGAQIRVVGPLAIELVALIDVPVLRRDLTFGSAGSERVLHQTGPVSLGAALCLALAVPAS